MAAFLYIHVKNNHKSAIFSFCHTGNTSAGDTSSAMISASGDNISKLLKDKEKI